MEIDPPYNTGNDFVYNDNFYLDRDEYLKDSGQYDEDGNRLEKNLESNGRFHTDWLNMMYPRLKLARNLLTDDGVIFISIDDNEVSNLKKLCDEIFGESNFIGNFVVNTTPNGRDYGHIAKQHEYCLFYSKSFDSTQTYMIPDLSKQFKYEDSRGGFNIHPLYNSNEQFHKENRPNLYYPFYINPKEEDNNGFLKISLIKQDGLIEVYPPKSQKNKVQFVWRWGKSKAELNLNKEIVGYKIGYGEYRIVQKMRNDKKLIRSLLLDKTFTTRKGTAELEKLIKGKFFDFPKPIELIKNFIQIGTSDNDIILDFFSGSATTAHATMELNATDGGTRRFIMVQLPEEVDTKSVVGKKGYRNIPEIAKDRIRFAGQEVLKENGNCENIGKLDIGFRVLKTDSSNMKDVFYSPVNTQQSLLDSLTDNIKEDRSPEDLLFQIMLDLGISLSSKIEVKEINGKNIFSVEDGFLIACFDKDITEETVKAIAEEQPYYAVFRDSSIADDSVATNFEQIFQTLSPQTVRKVI